MRKLISLAALAVLSLSAHATPIEYRGYSRDSGSQVISGGGREWLMWTETLGKSVEWFQLDPAAQGLRDAGWRLAGREQMNTLFTDFEFVKGHAYERSDLSEDYDIVFYERSQRLLGEPFRAFVGLFGDTYAASGLTAGPLWTTHIDLSWALYETSLEGQADTRFVGWVSDWHYNGERAEFRADASISDMPATVLPMQVAYFGSPGLSLYRDAALTVPLPGSLPLCLLGLAGLRVASKRRRA